MLRILCAAAAISLVLGILTEGLAEGWMEGASIPIAVIIIVTVTSGNNYIKEQQFQKLYSGQLPCFALDKVDKHQLYRHKQLLL